MASFPAARGPGHAAPLVPPVNFSAITKNIYRSAYPVDANVPYLRHIGIRTVVLLSIEALPAAVMRSLKESLDGASGAGTMPATPLTSGSHSAARFWAKGPPESSSASTTAGASAREVHVIEIADMSSWRVDSLNDNDDFSQKDVTRALDFAVDVQWHPVIFCCPTGELQTSVVTGCIRRYQGWSLAAIYGECELFTTLQRELRMSVMCFIQAWRPEEYPISTTAILQRHREWSRGRTQQMHQHRKQLRRLLRQQQLTSGHLSPARHTPLSHLPPPRSGSRASDEESFSSSEGESNDEYTDNSTRSSTHSGAMPTAELRGSNSSGSGGAPHHAHPHTALGGENMTEEGILLAGSGARPPFSWQRRRPLGTSDGVGGGASPSVAPTSRGEAEELLSAPHSRAGRYLSGPGTNNSLERGLSEVVFADWFEEARRRNPDCCVDTVDQRASFELDTAGDGGSLDTADHGDGAAGVESAKLRRKEFSFPKSDDDAAHVQNLPPHIRYAGVRNPPVLDDRSTFTKQSIVDEDDD